MSNSSLPARATSISFQDADLVRQVRGGDTAAFGYLVAKYQDRVYNTCWRICGNVDDARDLTQDAFLKALESIGRFEEKSSFYTWLFRIAVNLTISHGRKRQRRATVPLERNPTDREVNRQVVGLIDRLHGSEDDNPERAAQKAETNEFVIRALNALDEDHRTVLVLKDIESLGYEEIAAILSVQLGTVKSRVHRARMALREKLKPVLVRG